MFRTLLFAVGMLLAMPVFSQISFTGAGVVIAPELRDHYPVIQQVLKNSPAEDMGISPGEILWSVDGKSTQDLTTKEVTLLIKGEAGAQRVLVVGSNQRTVTITLRLISGKCTTGDCRNGEGRIEEPNGDIYVGNFTNGKFDGYGMYYYYKGEHMYARYDGHFAAGKRDGEGVLDNYDGGYKLKGTFKADKVEGKATLTFYDVQGSYTGNFASNLPSGSGTITFADGSTKNISPATIDAILIEAGARKETVVAEPAANTGTQSSASTNAEKVISDYDFTAIKNEMLKVENSLLYALDKYAEFHSKYMEVLRENSASTAEQQSGKILDACVGYIEQAYNGIDIVTKMGDNAGEVTEAEFDSFQDWSQAIAKVYNAFNGGLNDTATISTWYWLNVNVDSMRGYLEEAAAARHSLF